MKARRKRREKGNNLYVYMKIDKIYIYIERERGDKEEAKGLRAAILFRLTRPEDYSSEGG